MAAMSEKDTSPAERPPAGRRLSGRKKLALAAAMAAMLVGGALWLIAPGGQAPAGDAAGPRSTGTGAAGLDGSGLTRTLTGPGPVGAAATAIEHEPAGPTGRWEPALFRLGFSFFAGFAMGYALRVFFRMSMVVIGVILLALFGLQYAGLIAVDWSAMSDRYDDVLGWLRAQTSGFRGFITGQLPSAASGVAGLVGGWRR